MDKVRFYSVIFAACSMMIAMLALLATMLGLVSRDISEVYVQTFGLLALAIMLGGLITAKICDWKHYRATRRP